jgi:hypothetical protein
LAGAIAAVGVYRLIHTSQDEITAAQAERALPNEQAERGAQAV